MAFDEIDFTTGPSSLPDVGTLLYNGCEFSPLFSTKVRATPIKDSASRTIKYIEYSITVDGYVTMPEVDFTIAGRMNDLRRMLTAPAGVLIYQGRGLDIVVNAARGGFKIPAADNTVGKLYDDVAWGPIPELMEFQPLGNGSSAKVVWTVTTRIPEVKPKKQAVLERGVLNFFLVRPILEFTYDTEVTYAEDGFSKLTLNGTLEIALTRSPQQDSRTLTQTADDLREIIGTLISKIDLNRFHITSRNFKVSRDKRTIEWSVTADEKPYMDLPKHCTLARGNFRVRPTQSGMGLCSWICSLHAIYTVAMPRARRLAWINFLALLQTRLHDQKFANTKVQNGIKANANVEVKDKKQAAFVIDFNIDEGIYLDSKTVSFSCSWRLITTIDAILVASGLWHKVRERDDNGKNLWAISMSTIMKEKSWLENRVNPADDIIVDFGSR